MKIIYTKTYTLPQDLISLLKQRGLVISNKQRAINYLTNIGYYRLSAYFYPLLEEPKTDHLYKKGVTFDMALNMYRFDRKLRVLLFNEIEKIEVAIRSAMSNRITEGLNDVFWMTNAAYFYNPIVFAKTEALIQVEIDKTKEEFITHFQSKYSSMYPPVWMIAEIIPFGLLCGIFNNLCIAKLKKKVAHYFNLSLPVFSSWIITMVNLRNLCGHHCRTWNREIPVTPAELKSPTFPWIDSSTTDMKRIYYRICIIKYLLFTVSSNNTFTQKLKSLLTEFPTIDIKAMGFPSDWDVEPLWQ